MAKINPIQPDRVPDTDAFSRTRHQGTIGDPHDTVIDPASGVMVADSVFDEFERLAKKAYKERSIDPGSRHGEYLIPTATVLAWADELRKQGCGRSSDRHAEQYQARCHEGTDAENPDLLGNAWRRSDDHKVDHSQSTILVTVTSSSPAVPLNGSLVRHSRYVSIRVTTPDGRRYLDLALTFDQLAAALTSSSPTPCTLRTYWSLTSESVAMEEVVRPADSLEGRMEKRIKSRLDDVEKRLSDLELECARLIDGGRPTGVKKMAELLRDLAVAREHLRSNRAFAVEQAREELSSAVEQSVVLLAGQYGFSSEAMLAGGQLQSLLPGPATVVSPPNGSADAP